MWCPVSGCGIDVCRSDTIAEGLLGLGTGGAAADLACALSISRPARCVGLSRCKLAGDRRCRNHHSSIVSGVKENSARFEADLRRASALTAAATTVSCHPSTHRVIRYDGRPGSSAPLWVPEHELWKGAPSRAWVAVTLRDRARPAYALPRGGVVELQQRSELVLALHLGVHLPLGLCLTRRHSRRRTFFLTVVISFTRDSLLRAQRAVYPSEEAEHKVKGSVEACCRHRQEGSTGAARARKQAR